MHRERVVQRGRSRAHGHDKDAVDTLRSPRRLSVATLVAVVITLAAAGFGAWGTHAVVRDQERRLLNERASEVALFFSSAVSGVTSSLTATRGVLKATRGSSQAFVRSVSEQVETGKNSLTTLALMEPVPGGFRVAAEDGPLLTVGQVVGGPRAATLQQTRTTRELVSTPVIGTGTSRAVGLAIDASAAVGGIGNDVLYREQSLGSPATGRQPANAPFHEISVVLYADNSRALDQLIISSTGGALPAKGTIYKRQPIGASTWLLGVRAKASLVGGVAANAWWIVLLAVLAVGFLLAGLIDFALRRRDATLALYVAESQQAERLQRSLLPTLPELRDVELAARYEAGGTGQKVGGDWFDAFPLSDGGVGFAIGDVIGHDLEAAAAMSQVRAALRAYAYEGDEPACVLTRLDRLVMTFDLTQLVSVIYGVLSPLRPDGSRVLRLANAGHLPPLLQEPGGTVTELTGGASVVIGVPVAEERTQCERVLAPGSTLLLFTDGLLEAPELSLAETLPQLAEVVAQHAPSDGCEALCEQVLASRPNRTQRDDIALLALRLAPVPAEPAHLPAAPASAGRQAEAGSVAGSFNAPLSRR